MSTPPVASAPPPVQGFPNRPLEAARPRAVFLPMLILGVSGLLFSVSGAFMAYRQFPGLLVEHSLRGKGSISSEVDLRGKCKTSRAIFTDCTGTLRFRTLPEHGGRIVSSELDYLMMLELDQGADLFVRYDPANPDRHTASWGQNHFWNRVGTSLALVGIVLALGIGTFYSAFTPLRQSRAFKASLASPRPAAVRLSNLRRNGKKITATVHWWDQGKARKADQGFRADEEPLFLGRSDHGLALLSPQGVPTVLDSSLSDLQLSEAERERILLAAQAWPATA